MVHVFAPQNKVLLAKSKKHLPGNTLRVGKDTRGRAGFVVVHAQLVVVFGQVVSAPRRSEWERNARGSETQGVKRVLQHVYNTSTTGLKHVYNDY